MRPLDFGDAEEGHKCGPPRLNVARFGEGSEQLDGGDLDRIAFHGPADVDPEVVALFGGLELGEDLLIAGVVELEVLVVAGDDAEAAAGALEGAVTRGLVDQSGISFHG